MPRFFVLLQDRSSSCASKKKKKIFHLCCCDYSLHIRSQRANNNTVPFFYYCYYLKWAPPRLNYVRLGFFWSMIPETNFEELRRKSTVTISSAAISKYHNRTVHNTSAVAALQYSRSLEVTDRNSVGN